MFGNVLNNTQIEKMWEKRDIIIDPFDAKRLKLAHYPLTVGKVLWLGDISNTGNRNTEMKSDFCDGKDYVLEPSEYCVIEINEFLHLTDGIVGHFIPNSILIEQGFSLTAGKIDPGYGNLKGRKQQIRFGLKNLKDTKNYLHADQNIAYVYFIDLRGLNNQGFEFSAKEIEYLLRRRKASDDGVDYN